MVRVQKEKNSLTAGSHKDIMEEYPQYRSFIPEVTESMVREVIEGLHMRVRTQAVVDLVMKRYDLIPKT